MFTPSIFRFNDFYGLSLLEWKRTKLVFKILRASLLDFIHSATAWVQLFLISEKSVIGTSRLKRYEKDSWIYGLSKSAVNCQEPFWLMFICVCLPIVLIQSNFNTPGDTSRLDANRFSHSVQPIFRDIFFFLFTRNNYTSGNRNINFAVSLLKLVSKRLFPFTVNWSDYILALKLQMCYVNYALCPSPFAIHSNTNHKTKSECSGSGL